jgi:predicted Zn-dependent peptidase
MAVDRTRLPPIGPDAPFTFPAIHRSALPSGLRVWTVEHRAVPLITCLLLLPVGASADPTDRPGLAALTSDMLDEGCGDLDAIAVHDALGRIGAHLESEIGSDATLLTLTSLTRFADRGFQLLADMIARPTIAPRDFDRVRELRVNRLVQLRSVPGTIADRAFTEQLYGPHPYGHLPIGTEASLRVITRDDAAQFHARAYRPSQATVIVAGDGTHAELAELAGRAFGGWRIDEPAAALPDVASIPVPGDGAPRLALVHRPGAAQSELRIGHVAAARGTPDYHALIVMNMVLGGQFVSRINMNLRERRGYTYGARTVFEFRKGQGPFVLQASVQSDATVDAIREAMFELDAIRGDRPVTREELETGRAALTRGYPRNFETADQVARAAAQMALYDLPDDYFTTFVPKVLAVDEAAATAAAQRYLDPSRLSVVIVGDRDRAAGLSELGLGPVDERPS